MNPQTAERTSARLGTAALAMMLVASCAVGPDYQRPDDPKGADYVPGTDPKATRDADGQVQTFLGGKQVAADWWRLFGNPKLDALIAQSLTDNPTLQASQATLRQSQDILQAGYGIFIPQVSGNLGATRQTTNFAAIGQKVPSSVFNLFTMSASVSYAIDIWGGQRRQVESLKAQVEAQRANTEGTYLMLVGNVVNTAIAQAAYRSEIDATQSLIALEKDQVGLTQAQAQAGTAPYSNVLSLQSELSSTEATLPPLQEKIDQANHLLATLIGKAPVDFPSTASEPGLELKDFKLPTDLPVSMPSALVRQRPDILLAEAQLVSANAQIGVTTAAMFPNLTLSSAVGLDNGSLSNLFQPSNLFWSLGASLAGPIIDGGTRWFQRKAAIEAHDAVLATYKQTVLGALAQVADALKGLEHDAETVQAQSDAIRASADALKLTRINYDTGVSTYLQVLIADEQYHQATLGYVQAQAQRLQDTVALYVALGGGWWNAPTPVADRLSPAN